MTGKQELRGDREPLLNERERLAQILVLFGHQGVKGLAGVSRELDAPAAPPP